MNDDELWAAARSRMWGGISAVFWQDFGIGGEDHDRAVDWILDQVVRPEYFGAIGRAVWSVFRQDDNGNHFEMARGLSYGAAQALMERFEAAGHKQVYWLKPACVS